MTDQDHQEGYRDGMAGSALQPRQGAYIAGYSQGAIDRVAMLLHQLLAMVPPPPAPLPFKLLEDE